MRARGLAGVFASPGLGGRVARRFLPLALIAPVLLGWLAQMGENAGLFDRTQDTAVFAAAMMLVLVTLTGRIAHSLEASDAERQRAEATQARLAMIVETSDDAIISMSVQGSILSWNAGAERMFGYRAEEAVGQPITLPIPPQRLHEEEQNLQRLRRGEAVAHYETQWITKDGRTIDVALTTSTLKDADGRVVGASKILRDIGARKQAEIALRESEQRLRLATDAAELGIWTWQPEGDRISWENERPYDILGMPRTDAPLTAARFAAEFVHPEDLAAFEQEIGRAHV